MMGFSLRRFAPALLMLALIPSGAMAGLRVQPMSYDLRPSGAGAQQDLRVENTGDTPLPVELRVERREILPDGSERRSPADDAFLLFPPQGLVPPNGFQTFRVRYIGDPAVTRTALYVVTVAQLPVETGTSGTTGVQFLFNLGTLAAVSPAGAEANLVVTSVTPATTAGKLRIEVRNDGNLYARMGLGRWIFTSADGHSETLEGVALQRTLPQPLIEPGTSRIIELPVSGGFRRDGARATFELSRPAR
jgi:fimbrial chaperone protein